MNEARKRYRSNLKENGTWVDYKNITDEFNEMGNFTLNDDDDKK